MGIMRNRKKAKKGARGAQRKELVNGIGLKANKHKGKGYGNWAKGAQGI